MYSPAVWATLLPKITNITSETIIVLCKYMWIVDVSDKHIKNVCILREMIQVSEECAKYDMFNVDSTINYLCVNK